MQQNTRGNGARAADVPDKGSYIPGLSLWAREALRSTFGDQVQFNEPLARHTSSRIGGPADAFLIVRSQRDLRQAVSIAWDYDLPLFILGGGSNILVSDAGVRGLVVRNQTGRVVFDPARRTGQTKPLLGLHLVVADSGLGTIMLTRRCIKRGLGGIEWAIGVPGTLGGAIVGNAGAHGGDMASVVAWVDVLTPEGSSRWTNAELEFEYRSSIIKRESRKCVILAVGLALIEEDSAALQARADEFNERRKATQPPGATIGSMFKNPPDDYAGRLIDVVGLKGERRGGAQISDVHGNFFLNEDKATASDVKALVDVARKRVAEEFGVMLELEVELVGEWE
jgi:UDP-N-acetylmuramate dehydrogenase